MCIISNLVVIDQFTTRSIEHLYILTHWHADHYQGITRSWDYGPIYTSSITYKLLLSRFSELADRVAVLPMGIWTTITFKEHAIKVLALDSNHMAGSIMVLLNIRDKYYLHTGDMRFNRKIAQAYPQLFRPAVDDKFQCNYQIEELHIDNTFCDPIFQFPTRSKALRMVVDLVAQHRPTRLFLCTDSIGKQQAFVLLSRYYGKKVAVNKQRMDYIKQMFSNWEEYFTGKRDETWLEVIGKEEREKRVVEEKGSIGVTLTGWTNLQHSHPDGYRSYLVPYSLHSNFAEIELLVSWVKPRKLLPIVREGSTKWQSLTIKVNSIGSYMFNLLHLRQRGLQFLRQQYCVVNDNDY